MCLEYEYKTLAVLDHAIFFQAKMEATPMFSPTTQTNQEAASVLSPVVTPPRNLLSVAVAPTCIPPNPGCRPGVAGKRPENIPIIERTWGRPTASSAKLGEIGIQFSGNGDRAEPVISWVRVMWFAGVLGGFAGVMVAL